MGQYGNRNSPLHESDSDKGGNQPRRRIAVAVSAFFQVITASGFVPISVPSPKLTDTHVSALVAANEKSNAVETQAPAAVGKAVRTARVLD